MIFAANSAEANQFAELALDLGFQSRSALTSTGLIRLIEEWHPQLVVLVEPTAGMLREVRNQDDAAQIIVFADTLEDPRALAAYGVHAWHMRQENPLRVLAALSSSARRAKEVLALRRQRISLQSVLTVAPRLTQLRSLPALAMQGVQAFVEVVDPAAPSVSGVLAVRDAKTGAVVFHGTGRYAGAGCALDLPGHAAAELANALGKHGLTGQGPTWVVLAASALNDQRVALYIEGVDVPSSLDDLCALYAGLLAQAYATVLLFERSTVDGLTGLYTRAYGLQRLTEALSLAARHPATTSVMALDLDFFKSVNDRLGHAAGDAVLAGIAETLKRQARLTDVPLRLGGEEFLLVMPHTDETAACIAAERVRRAVAAWRGEYEGEELRVTVSIGVADASPPDRDSLRLLERADAALYRAKAEGRNCVVRASQL